MLFDGHSDYLHCIAARPSQEQVEVEKCSVGLILTTAFASPVKFACRRGNSLLVLWRSWGTWSHRFSNLASWFCRWLQVPRMELLLFGVCTRSAGHNGMCWTIVLHFSWLQSKCLQRIWCDVMFLLQLLCDVLCCSCTRRAYSECRTCFKLFSWQPICLLSLVLSFECRLQIGWACCSSRSMESHKAIQAHQGTLPLG